MGERHHHVQSAGADQWNLQRLLPIHPRRSRHRHRRSDREVWQRGAQWTFGVPTTSEIKEVILDPEKKLPDWNRENNKLKKAF